MKVTYDDSANATYLYIKNVKSREIEETDSFEIPELLEFGEINLDFDKNKKLIGIECMSARKLFLANILASAARPSADPLADNPYILVFYNRSQNETEICFKKIENNEVVKSETLEIEGLLISNQMHFDFDKDGKILQIRFFDADKILSEETLEAAVKK